MQQIIEFLFGQYSEYTLTHTLLELFAVTMNILSVIYAKRNSILVYPEYYFVLHKLHLKYSL